MSVENDLEQAGIIGGEIMVAFLVNSISGVPPGQALAGAIVSYGIPGGLNAFGLGNSGNSSSAPDYAPYFEAIQSQLKVLETASLQNLENLSDIQLSINWVKAGITNIEMDLEVSELQNLLLTFGNNTAIISSWVEQYANAIDSLATGTDLDATAKSLFNLLSDGATPVDVAMKVLYTTVHGQGELQGILDFQVPYCQSFATAWANIPANFKGNPGGNQDTSGIPFYDNSQLITAPFGQVIPQFVGEYVVPTFQSILNAMGQGLVFIGAAWQNTNNDDMLAEHITNIQNIVQKMNSFWATLTDPADVNTFICQLMSSYMQAVGDLGSITDVDNYKAGSQPFGNNWAWWALPGRGTLADMGWYHVHSGVVDMPPNVTELGGTLPAFYIGHGWGEGTTRIPGLVCASATATIPTPASAIPAAPPMALAAFLNAVQGTVIPKLLIAYPGMTAQALVCGVLGETPSTATWAMNPSDGSAGTVTAGSTGAATYTPPSTVSAPAIALIEVTMNGTITSNVAVVLLPVLPTITVTPSLA